MKVYHVYLDTMFLDSVYYDDDSTVDEVRKDLIDRWRYNSGIVVELGWSPLSKPV